MHLRTSGLGIAMANLDDIPEHSCGSRDGRWRSARSVIDQSVEINNVQLTFRFETGDKPQGTQARYEGDMMISDCSFIRSGRSNLDLSGDACAGARSTQPEQLIRL